MEVFLQDQMICTPPSLTQCRPPLPHLAHNMLKYSAEQCHVKHGEEFTRERGDDPGHWA